MPFRSSFLNVLLIDDDQEDYLLTRAVIDEIDATTCNLTWEPSYERGLAAIERGVHDVCLLDHRLGARTGIELLGEAARRDCSLPIIMLTDEGGGSIERAALEAGAADYLVKSSLDAEKLWRAVRHSVERGRARSDSRQRDRMFRAVFDLSADAMVVLDDDGSIVKCNAAGVALFGRGAEEPAGPAMQSITEAFRKDTASIGVVEIAHGDGTRRTVEFRGTADILPGRHLLVVRDITVRLHEEEENRRLRARLAIADRMASVGTLAAGVAHEINNPLAALVLNLEAARSEAIAPSELLDDAIAATARVRSIVADLKLFSRSDDEVRGLANVHTAIDSTLGLVRNEVRYRAQLVRDYGSVPMVWANEGRLGQVFLNLIINAAQAIDEGAADRNEIRVTTRTEGDKVVVEVSDTGCGIAPEDVGRVFDPFFTTKAVGQGTGLGLPICHSIVTSLGGELTVDSAPGRGTTFRVSLPASVEKVPLTAIETPAPLPSSFRARILVIDDEPGIVRAVSRILSREHEVVELSDAREALRRLLAGDRFDLILCDLMMPFMTGMELHRALEESLPAVAKQMVFLCGGAFTQRARAFLDAVPNTRIDKPFNSSKLRRAVHEELHGACADSPGREAPHRLG